MTEERPVWDRVTRIWHWLIVPAIPAMWWTAQNDFMDVHIALGSCLTGLLLFRIFWGLWGSSTARFSHFLRGPKSVFRYAGTLMHAAYKPHFGHNPLGGLSVIVILLVLTAQIGTGLVAEDTDGLYSGPLSRFVDYDTAHAAADLHATLFNIVIASIVLHLAAIAFYAMAKKVNLTSSMITGKTQAEATNERKAGLKKPGVFVFVMTLAMCAGLVVWLLQ